jgi:hypothetical protein
MDDDPLGLDYESGLRFGEIAITAIGIVFAALCIWLIVRIVNRRERWAKRTLAVVVGLPMLYLASFAPVIWLEDHDYIPIGSELQRALKVYAKPVHWVYEYGPQSVRDALDFYGGVCRGPDH